VGEQIVQVVRQGREEGDVVGHLVVGDELKERDVGDSGPEFRSKKHMTRQRIDQIRWETNEMIK
jgi:hypothetical protein